MMAVRRIASRASGVANAAPVPQVARKALAGWGMRFCAVMGDGGGHD